MLIEDAGVPQMWKVQIWLLYPVQYIRHPDLAAREITI